MSDEPEVTETTPDTATLPVKLGKEMTRKLKVEIDEPTLGAFGNELADLIQKLESLEDEKKASANEYKCKIDSAGARAHELANLIRAKCRYLDVMCREEFDYAASEFRLRRLDTGDVVESRPLKDEEKQTELPLPEDAAAEVDEGPEWCQGCQHADGLDAERCVKCNEGDLKVPFPQYGETAIPEPTEPE